MRRSNVYLSGSVVIGTTGIYVAHYWQPANGALAGIAGATSFLLMIGGLVLALFSGAEIARERP
jgi:hypothetical protein